MENFSFPMPASLCPGIAILKMNSSRCLFLLFIISSAPIWHRVFLLLHFSMPSTYSKKQKRFFLASRFALLLFSDASPKISGIAFRQFSTFRCHLPKFLPLQHENLENMTLSRAISHKNRHEKLENLSTSRVQLPPQQAQCLFHKPLCELFSFLELLAIWLYSIQSPCRDLHFPTTHWAIIDWQQ